MRLGLKLALFFIAIAFVAAALFSQGSFRYEQNKQEARFCKNCHEMKPDVYTWQYSSHNRVGCLKCHQDIELFNFTYKHMAGLVTEPVVQKTFMPNTTCEACHSQQRKVTATQGLIFPHQLHLTKGIDCVDCHNNVTHFSISEKVLKGQIEFDAIDNLLALKLSKDNITMTMSQCLKCHNGQKATNQCLACHVEYPNSSNMTNGQF